MKEVSLRFAEVIMSGHRETTSIVMPKVFICHAAADRAMVARDIIDLLRDHGIDVWFAEDEIAIGRQWERSILEGLRECDWFLVALTPHAAKSEWVKDEIHWAIEERPGRIVPVLLEDCNVRDIHIRLPRIQYLDFRNVNDDARKRLILIEASPSVYPEGYTGESANNPIQKGGDLNEVLYPRTPLLLRHRSPRPHYVPLHPQPERGGRISPRSACRARAIPHSNRSLSRRHRRLCGVHLYLVLARRSLCTREHPFCSRSCIIHEGNPWGKDQKRPYRLPQDRRTPSQRHDPHGVCLSPRDAGHSRPPAPPQSLRTQTGRLIGAHPKHQQPVQPS